MKHFYGYIPDKHDERDFKFSLAVPQLPPAIDLRKYCSPVRDQGSLGACTGFAITGLKELLEIRDSTLTTLSPLFLYYEERKIEHTISEDSGANPRDGFKVLTKTGCAPEIDEPYDTQHFKKAPTKKALKEALNYKISSYHRLHNLLEAKSSLSVRLPIVLGFNVYESFESDSVEKTGNIPMPGMGEQVLGGHAVLGVGYKNDSNWAGGGYLIAKNSWGTSWGDKGYFYMPYDFINKGLVTDMWMGI